MKKITLVFNFIIIFISLILGIVMINENGLYDSLINFAIIPLLILPFIIQKFIKISNPTIFVYSIHVFIAVFLGSIMNLYNTISWFDTFAHTLFGFLCCLFLPEGKASYNHWHFPEAYLYNFVSYLLFLRGENSSSPHGFMRNSLTSTMNGHGSVFFRGRCCCYLMGYGSLYWAVHLLFLGMNRTLVYIFHGHTAQG